MTCHVRSALVWATICVLLSGCSSTTRQPADPVNTDDSTRTGQNSGPDDHRDWAQRQCAEAAARTEALRIESGWDDSCADRMSHVTSLLDALDVCEVSATGVWTSELTAMLPITRGEYYDEDDTCLTMSGDWRLAFRQPNAENPVASIDLPVDFDLDNCDSFEAPLPPAFYDYDGNGEPEVLYADVRGQAMCDGGDETVFRALWTLDPEALSGDSRGRKTIGVTPYGFTASRDFIDVEDVDEDGRPDLVIQGDLTYWPPDCAGFGAGPMDPAPRLAHALPAGDFSLDDDVAREFLARSCPGAPLGPLDYYEEHGVVVFNPYLSMDMLVCFKVWGASPEESLEALSTECASFVEFDECSETPPGMSFEDMRARKLCPLELEALALEPVELVLP